VIVVIVKETERDFLCVHTNKQREGASERASEIRLSVYLPIYREISLSVKRVLLELHLWIRLSVYLPTCLSLSIFCLHIFLSIHLFICVIYSYAIYTT